MVNLRVDKITSTETFETTGSVQFDGTGDYLTIPSNADLNPESGDFTLEMWIYPESYNPSSLNSGYNTLYVNSATNGLWIGTFQGSFIVRKYGVANVLTYSSTPTVNEWTHVAVTREGSSLRLFYDGVLQASATDSTAFVTAATNIGYDGSSVYWHGHISNLRFIKGKALYTENFKVPMRELEVTPETVLLACQSKTNTILEKTGKTITAGGDAVANELTPGLLTPVPKDGGSSAIKGSVEFTGTAPHPDLADYLGIEKSSDFAFGTGDFTIEMWVYHSDITGQQTYFGDTYGGTAGIYTYKTSNNEISLYDTAQRSLSAQNVIKANEWHHVAWTRESGTLRAFLDGVKVDEDTYTGNFTNTQYYIGNTAATGSGGLKGFISNLRVNKGTALYTEEFIPPTRELKKVPGTVLLCCQDPDDPLTEATGKTITGYGSLQQDSPELVTDGEFESASNWSSAASDWTVGSGQAVINSSNSGYDYLGQLATGLLNGEQYELVFNVTNYSTGRLELAQSSAGNIGVESPNGRNVFRFTYTGTTGGAVSLYSYTANTASFTLTNVSLRRVFASKSGSNFTPQVGDDRKVTFEGVTKVNSDAYFYLPTGDTVTRDSRSSRGVSMGGYDGSNAINSIYFITISSLGNGQDFGDLTNGVNFGGGGCGSSTRGILGGGEPIRTRIDSVTIATTGNSINFGSLDSGSGYVKACSNQTRGIWGGGRDTPLSSTNVVQYVTIASTGNSEDFGILTSRRTGLAGLASPIRGIFSGGYTHPSPTAIDDIDYVTIATTGNALDFGDLLTAVRYSDTVSSGIRGVIGGGSAPVTNTIQYVNIASTGDAQDFGDLSMSREHLSGTDNSIRGVFIGGVTPTAQNVIDHITIATTGDAQDFGDLSKGVGYSGSTSDSHGGLG